MLPGNPGYSGSFDGTASAGAAFGHLGALAHANISGSMGYVRYAFSVEGQLSSLGSPGPYLFGTADGVLDIQQGAGPLYHVFSAEVSRGGLPGASSDAPPAGWVGGIGSLSDGSTFYSVDLPIVWEQSFDLQVSLLAFAYGTALAYGTGLWHWPMALPKPT